ncbi:arrestin domain-containing protein 17-like [Achroia grisella]|uniref:arrestin domain-containing protein 17-like n=1 Tax=Achroia grisella TaxID=688607 RepID=UPI0027D248CB|nr:arrestin domain-containing protein 17-like [Achroia grisella]
MGVFSEINIFPSPNVIQEAGSDLFGVIKYTVDEDTIFNEINISLNGSGSLIVIESVRSGDRQTENVFRYAENYIKMNNLIVSHDTITPIGVYEIPFHFKLPSNIPSSLKYNTVNGNYRIDCTIAYNVTVVFKRSCSSNFNNTVIKAVHIESGITPRLRMTPITYGHQKKILQLFSKKNGVVNIKADIQTCIVEPNGKVKLSYIINNDTNVTVKSVQIKLVEQYTFSDKVTSKLVDYNDIIDTKSKTGRIKSGNTQCMDIEIDLPSGLTTIEFSKLVMRNYFIYVTVVLPFPHSNIIMKIPIQIGYETVNDNMYDGPPAYYDAIKTDAVKS